MPDQMMSPSAVADTLIEIAKTARDSQEGYKASANDTSDPQLKSMFLGLAHTRGEQADELDRLIQRAGGQPPSKGGDIGGALHRLFVDLKATLTGNDRLAVLEEVVRGESYAEATYDKALRQDLPADMRQIIQRQHDSVKQSRDKFRQMKIAAGGAAGESSYGGIGETMSALGERVAKGGRQSGEWVSTYVTERPVMSTVVALGLGFLIGALTMMGSRSSSRSYIGRQGDHRHRGTERDDHGTGGVYGDSSYGAGRTGSQGGSARY